MIIAAVGLLGAAVGSFLGVVVDRLPRRASIVRPRSHCPHCGHVLGVFDLLPVVSYLLTRGRCRYCRARISALYPVVETLCAVGFVAVWYTSGGVGPWLAKATLLALLVALALTDLRSGLLPDRLTLSGLLAAVAFAAAGWTLSLRLALLGAMVGGGAILAIVVISRGGMGLGDAKMLAMIGAFLGPWGALGTLLWASFVGSVVGVGLLLTGRATRKTKLPFGPFLAVGAVLAELTVPLWLRFMGLG